MTSNPQDIARRATMRRLAAADAEARYMRARRQAAARNGYRGPLTRAELAARAEEASAVKLMRAIFAPELAARAGQ